jgi:cation diffusion facilitator CzcD-associated flavoprotein CzcO
MNAEDQTFVIVGAGLAGAKAAETLRTEGFDGRLVLIGDEPERPYERPPLSKEYLRGEADGKPYVHDQGFYGENAIELWHSTRATGLDTACRSSSWKAIDAWAMTACCLPPVPFRVASMSPAPSSTESTTCAPSPTPAESASGSRPASGWS